MKQDYRYRYGSHALGELGKVFFIWLHCVGWLNAQPQNELQEEPSRASAYVSVMALGPIPQRRYHMPKRPSGPGSSESGSGKHAVLLPPLRGAVPPAALYFKPDHELDESSGWSRLRIGFNNATGIQKVPSELPIKLYRRAEGDSKSYVSYLVIPSLPAASQTLVLLLPRTRSEKPWAKAPKLSVLNLGAKALRKKNLLVRNFSSEPVMFVVDAQKLRVLAPGQRRSLELTQNGGRHRIEAVLASRNKVSLINTSVRVPDDALSVVAFYNARPETNAGKSVGVFRTTVSKLSVAELEKTEAKNKPEHEHPR